MKRIAIYGKGGIGKSTTVSNMSAALAGKGYTVMQIGCDPKADSTISLRQGRNLTPVLDTYRDKIKDIQLEDMYTIGYNGVICVEAGGPTPGIGCAGRGVAKALDLLKQKNFEEVLHPDVVLLRCAWRRSMWRFLDAASQELWRTRICHLFWGADGDICGNESRSSDGKF